MRESQFLRCRRQPGNALTYDGEKSTGPDDIDGNTVLNSVSCTSTTFCVSVDDEGTALTYSGSSWSTLPIDAVSISSVSCTSDIFLYGRRRQRKCPHLRRNVVVDC